MVVLTYPIKSVNQIEISTGSQVPSEPVVETHEFTDIIKLKDTGESCPGSQIDISSETEQVGVKSVFCQIDVASGPVAREIYPGEWSGGHRQIDHGSLTGPKAFVPYGSTPGNPAIASTVQIEIDIPGVVITGRDNKLTISEYVERSTQIFIVFRYV